MSGSARPMVVSVLTCVCSSLCLLLASCGEPDSGPPPLYSAEDGWVRDAAGRALILRGLNLTGRNTWPDPETGEFIVPWLSEEDFENQASWGMSSVRFLMTWEGLEPERGVIDTDYLDRVAEAVRFAESAGIRVILDMHQDVYSREFNGDGAPAWAVITDGETFTPHDEWWLNFAEPAVQRAIDNFFENRDGILDEFVATWAAVAERFRDDPNVIGYDLLNEPYPGSLAFDLALADTEYLQPFYERLFDRLLEVDPNHIVFFEPSPVRTNVFATAFPSALGPFPAATGRIAFAPHLYDPNTIAELSYDGDIDRVRAGTVALREEADRLGVPLWVGEWSVWAGMVQNGDAYLHDQLAVMDEALAGWSFWNYNRYTDDPTSPLNSPWMLDELVRPQPSAVAGEPLEIRYESGVLTFRYREKLLSEPTEILVPGRVDDSFSVEVSPERKVTKSAGKAPELWLVAIWPEANDVEMTVVIE